MALMLLELLGAFDVTCLDHCIGDTHHAIIRRMRNEAITLGMRGTELRAERETEVDIVMNLACARSQVPDPTAPTKTHRLRCATTSMGEGGVDEKQSKTTPW